MEVAAFLVVFVISFAALLMTILTRTKPPNMPTYTKLIITAIITIATVMPLMYFSDFEYKYLVLGFMVGTVLIDAVFYGVAVYHNNSNILRTDGRFRYSLVDNSLWVVGSCLLFIG